MQIDTDADFEGGRRRSRTMRRSRSLRKASRRTARRGRGRASRRH